MLYLWGEKLARNLNGSVQWNHWSLRTSENENDLQLSVSVYNTIYKCVKDTVDMPSRVSRLGTVDHTFNPSTLEGHSRRITWTSEVKTSLENMVKLRLYQEKKKKEEEYRKKKVQSGPERPAWFL